MVEAALARGRRRVPAVRDRPGRDQPAAAADHRGQPARHPGAVRVRRHPRLPHDPAGADRDGGVLGPRGRSSRARRSRRGRRARSASTGRSRRWSTSRGTRAGAGSSRAPARIRTWARRSPAARSAASRATQLGAADRIIAGPKHFAGYGAALGGRDYDEVEPVRLGAVERLPAAVPGRGRGRRGQHHDRLHGSQRHPGHRQPLAAHRGAARRAGVSTGFVVSDANAVRNLMTHGFAARPDRRRRTRAVSAGLDLEMAIADPAYAPPAGGGRGRR